MTNELFGFAKLTAEASAPRTRQRNCTIKPFYYVNIAKKEESR